ncbi:hypothetical protein [Roseiterribacter gracilis]|uniref:hypothetical protein n=1 Tax=Roseiterribacter gracilis TaxID=2812848 RepID=UPI003B43A6C6
MIHRSTTQGRGGAKLQQMMRRAAAPLLFCSNGDNFWMVDVQRKRTATRFTERFCGVQRHAVKRV